MRHGFNNAARLADGFGGEPRVTGCIDGNRERRVWWNVCYLRATVVKVPQRARILNRMTARDPKAVLGCRQATRKCEFRKFVSMDRE